MGMRVTKGGCIVEIKQDALEGEEDTKSIWNVMRVKLVFLEKKKFSKILTRT